LLLLVEAVAAAGTGLVVGQLRPRDYRVTLLKEPLILAVPGREVSIPAGATLYFDDIDGAAFVFLNVADPVPATASGRGCRRYSRVPGTP